MWWVAPKRVIAHLDCDAFYATVELIRRPELKGKPVIVAGSGPRSVVTTASYEARKFGVGSAMPASQARRLCPTAIVIPPDFTAYREKSREVWTLVRGRLEAVQAMGLDEAYADLTGVEKPLRVLRELIEQVKKETGIQISVGVGPNRLIAKCCSDLGKPAGFVAMGREEACIRFATAPTRRLPGIGPKTAERLAELGYATVGQLQEADEAQLAARFGDRWARYLKARATFHDDSPVETESGAAKSVSTERTFDTDMETHAELEEILRKLVAGAVRVAAAEGPPGPDGGDQGPSGRLDDGHAREDARRLDQRHRAGDRDRLALLRAYAPPVLRVVTLAPALLVSLVLTVVVCAPCSRSAWWRSWPPSACSLRWRSASSRCRRSRR